MALSLFNRDSGHPRHEVTPKTIGVYSMAQLNAQGISRYQVERAVKEGTLDKVRRGWFAESGANSAVKASVRRGCVLTCFSALRVYGVWVPPMVDTGLHMTTSRDAVYCGRVERARIGVHSLLVRSSVAGLAVTDLRESLAQALRCGSPLQCRVVLDSVLHLRLMERQEIGELLASVSKKKRRAIGSPNALAESGTESAMAVVLSELGLTFQQQVRIPGVGRVDVLVEESLVIELDSFEYHAAKLDQYELDRSRDAELSALGYRCLRFTYRQVFFHLDKVVAAVLRAVEPAVSDAARGTVRRKARRRGEGATALSCTLGAGR